MIHGLRVGDHARLFPYLRPEFGGGPWWAATHNWVQCVNLIQLIVVPLCSVERS